MFYLVARADIQVGEKTFEDQCVKFMKSGDGRHLLSWNGASIEVQINVDEIRIEFDTAEGALNHILISLDHYLLTVAECRARGWKSLTVTARHGQENHNCFYFRKSEGIRMDFVWLDDDPEVFTLERLTLPS